MLRRDLENTLKSYLICECPIIQNFAAIPMGGDFYSETVMSNFEPLADYGSEKWWLYVSKCKQCNTVWMIAQDDRIYDQFFFNRITDQELSDCLSGDWPSKFLTYGRVLACGRKLGNPPRFIDEFAYSLQWTVEDLLKERAAISTEEIAWLLGLSIQHAKSLVHNVKTYGADSLP